MPGPLDQRQRPATARLGVVLEQLLDRDRLLHPPRRPRRPNPSSIPALAQTLHRVKLNLRIEHRNEPIQIPLVEGADELTYRIVAQGALRTVALLVLLARPSPAGIVAADVVVLILDHGLDDLAAPAPDSGTGADFDR